MWHDAAWSDVILERPEVWGVEEFTGDAVLIRVIARTAPQRQREVGRELRERLKVALSGLVGAGGLTSALTEGTVTVTGDAPDDGWPTRAGAERAAGRPPSRARGPDRAAAAERTLERVMDDTRQRACTRPSAASPPSAASCTASTRRSRPIPSCGRCTRAATSGPPRSTCGCS